MARVVNYCYFCTMRNIKNGYAGLDQHAQISMKLLKTNTPGGIPVLSKDEKPVIETQYLPTDTPLGLATLDETGKLKAEQTPDGPVGIFKGKYANLSALLAAYPTAQMADFAYVTGVGFYYWNDEIIINGISSPAWVSQNISQTNYQNLNSEAQLAVPYIIRG